MWPTRMLCFTGDMAITPQYSDSPASKCRAENNLRVADHPPRNVCICSTPRGQITRLAMRSLALTKSSAEQVLCSRTASNAPHHCRTNCE
jgi:hypothetical protein